MASLGSPRIHLTEVDSTNSRARELAQAGAAHGTLVTAESQTEGRGRQGRSWAAPKGQSLLCSVVLRDPPHLLPLAAGLAVSDAVALHAENPMIKWPNDVLLDRRKVAGILAEGRPGEGWAIVGIGVNVAVDIADLPDDLRGTAATLGLPAQSIDEVLSDLMSALETRIGQSDGELLEAFRARDALFGERVAWSSGVGVGCGLDGTGRLIVDGDDGIRHLLDAGEVHLGTTVD